MTRREGHLALVSSDPVGSELRGLLAASGVGTWRWDAASGAVWWDATLEALCGFPPGAFGGTYEAWVATLHPAEADAIVAEVQRAIDLRGAYHFEHRVILPGGTIRWLECRGQTTVDADGTFTGTVGCAVDVTDRKEAEAGRSASFDRERRQRDRFEFLARLTDAAIAATDHRDYMRSSARAAVPKLGDWCSIHFIPEPGAAIERVVAHADPDKVAWAEALTHQFPYNPDAERGVAKVIRTGATEHIEHISDGLIDDALAQSDVEEVEMRAVLDGLGLTSAITVPLATKRGVIGAMQFVSAESGHCYDGDDVTLAQVAAGRVAEALDSLWLTEQHRRISATLQRALLPPAVPSIPGIDLAVAYWPAGTATEVGGDFYDVFRTAEASWSLLIGDVCGSGSDAAALTGIARHTVRAAARHGQDHRAVLEWLNEALRFSDRDRFVTAAYGTLQPDAGAWRLTLAAGGHPLPIVARRGAPPELLGRPGSLLGVFEQVNLTVEEHALEVGDRVIFYTDGITDLPPPYGLSAGALLELVSGIDEHLSADEVAEALYWSVINRLPAEQPTDDVALIVMTVRSGPPP